MLEVQGLAQVAVAQDGAVGAAGELQARERLADAVELLEGAVHGAQLPSQVVDVPSEVAACGAQGGRDQALVGPPLQGREAHAQRVGGLAGGHVPSAHALQGCTVSWRSIMPVEFV